MTLPRAILLDLDNTILAFDEGIEASWQKVCIEYARDIDGADPLLLRERIREAQNGLWMQPDWNMEGRHDPLWSSIEITRDALRKFRVQNEDLTYKIARTQITAMFEECLQPFPGALETLQELRKVKVRLSLISNGGAEPQRRKIDKFGLAGYFDAVVIEGELGIGKPDERAFRHALQQLGVVPQDTWMVGDNLEHDIAPARALGMTGVWVDWQGTGLPERSVVRPDRVVMGIRELVV